MTPAILGINENTVIGPEEGWESSTYYVVEVAFSKTNVIYQCIFYSGFLSDGKPAGYNCFLSPTMEERVSLHQAYYVKVVRRLTGGL